MIVTAATMPGNENYLIPGAICYMQEFGYKIRVTQQH